MTEWKPDIVIYHSPCDDGFGAAWAAHQRWGDDVEYYPATYGKPAPDVTGKNVLMADFSYKRAALDQMTFAAKSIVILDHHKTAQEDLAPFQFHECEPGAISPSEIPGILRDMDELGRPAVIAIFDMARSGARMTWDFCNGGIMPPLLIRYVEDRDLWRNSMTHGRAISLWLRSHRYDFDEWTRLSKMLDVDCGTVIASACAIETFYDQKVSEIVRTASPRLINNVQVPVANCTWAFASDVAHALLIAHPDAPFAATYYDRGDGSRTYSLRSDDDRDDVSVHAKRYGGGGHRNAAGFEVPAI
ncbi:phosphohydrolase [Sphingobium sp. YG1]|uniref:phosphohydrolase n=1 Tax=Sphingobium sp. YG1 TaxID=2082188 RepID=UPI000DBB62D7|nr:phosphohydrolase [Sphingobium sp. YG1]BBC99128.1 hypothetical protein YGS_C1P0384 [Sphingobium sp. YG1]